MPALTDGMYKTIFLAGIFFLLMGTFDALFVLSSLPADAPTDIAGILGAAWGVFAEYPELMLFNAAFIVVGLVILLIVVRELLPV